jgi:hypothetical protein
MNQEQQLMDRIRALRQERTYLQDLLMACQLVGWLPETLNRVVSWATVEASEADVERRIESAGSIIAKAMQVER